MKRGARKRQCRRSSIKRVSEYLSSSPSGRYLMHLREAGSQWIIWREWKAWDVAAHPPRRVPAKDILKQRDQWKFGPLLYFLRASCLDTSEGQARRRHIEKLVIGSQDAPLNFPPEAHRWLRDMQRPVGLYLGRKTSRNWLDSPDEIEAGIFEYMTEKTMDWDHAEKELATGEESGANGSQGKIGHPIDVGRAWAAHGA